MRKHSRIAFVVIGLLVASCGVPVVEEQPSPEPSEPVAEAPAEPAAEPETKPAEPAAETAAEPSKSAEPAGELAAPEWTGKYTKILPFEYGTEKGLAKAKELGKPAMLFYTASW